MKDITHYQTDWKLNQSIWDKYLKRNKNHIILKNEYFLKINDYGADHKVFEIFHNDTNRRVAMINCKKSLHLSFCIMNIENDNGDIILV